jgi:hypothetical protein
MKLSKLFFILVLLSSCQDKPLEVSEKLTFSESLSLRMSIQAIKKIKKLVNSEDSGNDKYRISGTIPSELCFDFKYPISVQYNDNSTVNVSNFTHFTQLILTETVDLHMTGIGFPFTVIKSDDNSEQVISNETEFQNLIEICGYGTLSFDEIKGVYGTCFNFNYPISVIINGVSYTFNSENDAVLLAAAFSQKVTSFNFVYPFSIKYVSNNQDANVPDFYTFTSIISGCN